LIAIIAFTALGLIVLLLGLNNYDVASWISLKKRTQDPNR
jgi:hypothetical protein